MSKLNSYKLREITTKIGSGATPRGGKSSYVKNGIPLIRSLNIYDLEFNYDDLAFINEVQAKKLENVIVEEGDVLLNITGASVGRITSVPKDLVPARVNQHVSIIRADEINLSRKYLKYFLVNPFIKKRLLGYSATGGTREALTKSDIENFQILIPDFKTQQSVGDILERYDSLIENNTKRIKILEESAQRLYVEWFVNFKYPGYKTVKFIDSSMGKVPIGWVEKRIDEVAKIVRGTSYSSEEINDKDGNYYLVNLKSFNRGGGFRFDGVKYFNGSVKEEQLLKRGDIVVAVTDMTTDRAVISRPARIPNIRNQKITFSADVVKIVPQEIPPAFTYYTLLDYRFTETTKNKANGANVLHLKPAAISEYKILVPDKGLLDEFENKCINILELKDNLSEKNEKLRKIRDLLIPQLVSGRRMLKV